MEVRSDAYCDFEKSLELADDEAECPLEESLDVYDDFEKNFERAVENEMAGSLWIAGDPYDGKERSVEGAMERGYLVVHGGEDIRALSKPWQGHRGNRFPSYVYAENLGSTETGWLPLSLLRLGCY